MQKAPWEKTTRIVAFMDINARCKTWSNTHSFMDINARCKTWSNTHSFMDINARCKTWSNTHAFMDINARCKTWSKLQTQPSCSALLLLRTFGEFVLFSHFRVFFSLLPFFMANSVEEECEGGGGIPGAEAGGLVSAAASARALLSWVDNADTSIDEELFGMIPTNDEER